MSSAHQKLETFPPPTVPPELRSAWFRDFPIMEASNAYNGNRTLPNILELVISCWLNADKMTVRPKVYAEM